MGLGVVVGHHLFKKRDRIFNVEDVANLAPVETTLHIIVRMVLWAHLIVVGLAHEFLFLAEIVIELRGSLEQLSIFGLPNARETSLCKNLLDFLSWVVACIVQKRMLFLGIVEVERH